MTWARAYFSLKKLKDADQMDSGLTFLWRIAEGKFLKKVRIPRPRLPKQFDALYIKEALERELEALCKAIVKRRDLGADGWGNCISCKANSNHLQWGHFVEQHKSPWLRFDPRNSAMQCAQCNGPGHGMRREFAKALDIRDGAGTADALEVEAKRRATWKPTISGWETKRDELKQIIKEGSK